jgi:hypothetical protein
MNADPVAVGDYLERRSHELRVIFLGHDVGWQSSELFESLLLPPWM